MQLSSNEFFVPIDRSNADKQEKNRIIEALRNLIARYEEVAKATAASLIPVASFDIKELLVPRTEGSTFDDVCAPVHDVMQKMMKTDAFAALLRHYSYPAEVQIFVDEQGHLFSMVDRHRFKLSIESDASGELAEEIEVLTECAAQIGGYIYSGDNISVEQWVNFEGFSLPQNVSEARNLMAYLQFDLPESPALGDYHELLATTEDSPFHLSDDALHKIKEVTLQITGGSSSLLQKLADVDFNLQPTSTKRESADKILDTFLKSRWAKAAGRAIHERLRWHLDLNNEAVSESQLQQMASAAVLLDLDAKPDQHLISIYDPYKPQNALLTPAQVREEVEQHLIEQGLAEENVAPLAAHLLLSRTAPEFLIQDVPAELTLDKPGWVAVAQAVALIEIAEPGSSRLMNFAQLKAFSALSPVTPEQAMLHEATAIAPVINWAVMNDIITYSVDKKYDAATLRKASDFFNRYIEALNSCETALSTVPPDRRKVAMGELRRVLPAGGYLEERAFRFNFIRSLPERSWLEAFKYAIPGGGFPDLYDALTTKYGSADLAVSPLLRMRLSLLDLYLSDDLIEAGRLTDKLISDPTFAAPAGAFLRLPELRSARKLFDDAFEDYYQNVQRSLKSIVKMAIANMPESDRYALTNGTLALYTVRKEANKLNPNSETQAHRDEAKARYGIILCSENAGKTRCYEFFTLRGLLIERPELADMLNATGINDATPSLSYVGKKTDFQEKNFELEWPLDFAAYQEGSEPRTGMTSSVVVEKLLRLHLQAGATQPVELFFSSHLDPLADRILRYHPVATRAELYASLDSKTELEEWRSTNEVIETAVINTLVPFKQCIEDIRSGDAPRVTQGIGGCILDGLAIIGLLVGVGATIANIVAKTGSTTVKVLSIAKAVARATASLLNPIDGLPQLAIKSFRKAGRGILLLSEHGADAISTATQQLRKLTGKTQTYDLVKAAQLTDIQQGHWRASHASAQAIDLAAFERNGVWHAHHFKVNGPWGPRLNNFKLFDGNPLLRLLKRLKPDSYTRGYMKKALPLAKTKLDSTVKLLSDQEWQSEVRQVFKYVFGTDTDQAVQHVAGRLREMRKDLDSFNLSNVSFKREPVRAVAALNVPDYKLWKKAVVNKTVFKESIKKFIKIYPGNLNELYRSSKFDESRIADVLIHEMSHGAPGTLDLYYGKTLDRVEYDAAALIDLGRNPGMVSPSSVNPYRTVDTEKFTHLNQFESIRASLPPLIQKNPALYNADSYELAVSLIDQIKSNPSVFGTNMATIETALNNTAADTFIGKLEINLGKAFH
ncbi:Toxin [Pseudomonas sp. IT-347P]|uniref:hypothetical protein n=1 Tax=Pseudomonas sp. IT-347P TaxID=3026458 RepID=UPI0039DFA947